MPVASKTDKELWNLLQKLRAEPPGVLDEVRKELNRLSTAAHHEGKPSFYVQQNHVVDRLVEFMTTCKECGAQNYSTQYREDCEEKLRMDAKTICFNCAYWDLRTEQENRTIINGFMYQIGTRPKGHPFSGSGGWYFEIEYFDGRKVQTHDLWHNGQIPVHFRARLPDTARFVK